jgi:LPXTG-motif cell wall-anchored protein
MRAKDFSLWVVGATLGVTALVGGSAAASDYPPDDDPVTTVARGGDPGMPRPSTDQLPATGSDSDATLKLAAGAVVAGAGLLAAAKLRRRHSAG